MNTIRKSTLPKKFHSAVERWRDAFIPDYPLLEERWSEFFPNQPGFELCALHDCSVCPHIEVGEHAGRPKFCSAREMNREQADHLLKAVRAQASTEMGSIQQHRLTLARAQDETDQFWILRMMAEELRHGYQMFSILLDDDWKAVTDTSGEEMVEEVLSMRTGSHVLGAFNIDFDSFLDNATFCCLIDRVGKYQLRMQKVSAYRPMAESMPPMLREEAFHMAAGVTPLRRWMIEAAEGRGLITPAMIQRAVHKWFPRALDMFGDERGGGRNVKFGFKDLTNGDAQAEYIEEVEGIVNDLNMRFVRARIGEERIGRDEARALAARVRESGDAERGVAPADLLRLPDPSFLRRRGVHAYRARTVDGGERTDLASFKADLLATLPEAYAASRDYRDYVDRMERVLAGTLSPAEAVGTMPELSRVGGSCPCSNAVRWVEPEAAA